MVSFEEIQAAYDMVAATGVLAAAIYYIMNLRNAVRDRRRQTILQKLPAISREYYEWNLQIRHDWKTLEQEWDEKYRVNPDLESKVWYLMNIYNTVGALYVEGLMSLEEVAQLYSPGWVIGWYEMFEFLIKRLRFNNRGEVVYPEYMASFERLYNDLKRKYPGVAEQQRMMHQETQRLMEAKSDSKTSSQ